MRTIVLDIETWAPHWQDGERGWEADSFPPTAFHEPVVICWLVVDNRKDVEGGNETVHCDLRLEVHRVDERPERDILLALAADFRKAGRLVTWNGRSFDMPIISCRAMALGLDWAWWHRWRHRYPRSGRPLMHYDLQDQLGDEGAARGIRLDRIAKMCGLKGKPEDIDGSKVEAEWSAGNRQRVADYCVGDVLDLYEIYLRFALSFFGIPADVLAHGKSALDKLRKEVAGEPSDQG
jgi:predicted PolB exonuclease-like 3'-5' exonuclease